MFDLEPATRTLTEIVKGVREDQLTAPTPCVEANLGDLLAHVDGLSLAFTAAATKTPLEGANSQASADATRLGAHWRTRIPQRLTELANAWRHEAAWTGMTRAGGLDLPGDLTGIIALNEVLVHGWDIAVASGQPYACEPDLVRHAYGFVSASVAENPQGSPGLFAPPVPVPPDAPVLDQLLGLSGRDPAWRAGPLRA